MRLHVVIERDGTIGNINVANDTAFRIFGSHAAVQKIYETMSAQGNVCTRCNLIARSAELKDGICIKGNGCDIDVDSRVLDSAHAGDIMAAHTLADMIWETFLKLLPHRDDPQPGTPPRGPSSPNEKWW